MTESTFERYVDRLAAARFVAFGNLTRDDLINHIRRIDSAVAEIQGHGFEPTPFESHPELATAVGLAEGMQLWVKDETENVSGSHKARHLFTAALEESINPSGDGPLAIASCGNAALGAAIIAAAVSRELEVYVPQWANDAVVAEIESLGARVLRIDRHPDVPGDPAHHAMVCAIDAGATPFSCQGTETPAAIDGGRTIAYEMIDRLLADDDLARIDRLFVQVGGGALGTALVTGLAGLENLATTPVVHVVQPVGNHPLAVAWDTLARELLQLCPDPQGWGIDNLSRSDSASEIGARGSDFGREITRRLRNSPQHYMRPWPTEPQSVATGILDDVTYDWVDLMEAMLCTGGHPIVCPEDDLRRAHGLARRHSEIAVCPTGSAGLAGLLTLLREAPDAIAQGERVAVLFTGHQRAGDPDSLA